MKPKKIGDPNYFHKVEVRQWPCPGLTPSVNPVVQACAEPTLQPHPFVKVSGIGRQPKTPSSSLHKSHGFNFVYGRVPSLITGANLANPDPMATSVSVDHDSASMGLGRFARIVQRRINMFYLIQDDETYGLNKRAKFRHK